MTQSKEVASRLVDQRDIIKVELMDEANSLALLNEASKAEPIFASSINDKFSFMKLHSC